MVHAQALFHRRQAPRICLLDMLGLEAEAECDAAAAPADVAPSEALSAWSGRSIPLALLQRDTLSTEELVTRSGVEEATPALISAMLQLVEASEALPMCPLPAYLSKAAGLRMLSEPLILAVDSELDTELDRRPPELRRHWLQVEPLVRMGELERVALLTTPVLDPASSRCAAA